MLRFRVDELDDGSFEGRCLQMPHLVAGEDSWSDALEAIQDLAESELTHDSELDWIDEY